MHQYWSRRESTAAFMASNKLAIALSRNSRRIISVLVYTFLEWVLIVFLLSNSFYSYMIRRFATYFGLKQPCIFCSIVDHLLHPAKTTDSYKDLLCQTHATEISKLIYCTKHQRFTESQEMCQECTDVICDQKATYEKMSECSCCGKISTKRVQNSRYIPLRESLVIEDIQEEKGDDGNHSCSECEPRILSDVGSFYLREAAEEDSNEDEEVSGYADNKNKSRVEESLHGSFLNEMKKSDEDIFSTIKQLKSDLESEQQARNKLYSELEAERNAAAIAANQTMAMITRLQEEKSAMQMEVLQYQRVMEEQAEYDQDALQLLNEVLAKRDREKEDLEKELDVYRERFSDYDAQEKAMLLVKKCSGEFSSSCSIDNDSDVLSIDLNSHYKKHENSDTSLVDCSKQWGAIENSLEELEEERMSIIKRLQELEEKLNSTEKQDEEMFKNEKQTEFLPEEHDKNDADYPNSEFCSQQVNLVNSCFSTSTTKSESHPKTMASVARRLLDLVESDDDEVEGMTLSNIVGVEAESKRVAIEKEMEHVFGRLQALEADTEFLRHCIASVNKGDEGVSLLREILQHLRELRDADIYM